MEEMICCLSHLFPPQCTAPIEGVGNCKLCIPDEDNVMCKSYNAITLKITEIKDEEG